VNKPSEEDTKKHMNKKKEKVRVNTPWSTHATILFKSEKSTKILEKKENNVSILCTKAGHSIFKVFMTRFGGWLFVYPKKNQINVMSIPN
jgi:hypothetical protein